MNNNTQQGHSDTLVVRTFKNFYEKNLETPAYLDLNTYFPEHKILEENWEVIRDEILKVIEQSATLPKFHEIDNAQEAISNNDGKAWSLFCIKLYGFWIDENAKKCPKTTRLLKKMKRVKTINFSILSPGKHIPPHEGPYKGIMRYQLPLEVPKSGDCYIIVDEKPYYWKEGKSVLFDDTYTHEVHNRTTERRIAMLLDIKRKDFNPLMYFIDSIYYKIIQIYILINGGLNKVKVD